MYRTTLRRTAAPVLAAAIALGSLAACGTDKNTTSTSSASSTSGSSTSTSASPLVLEDGWIKTETKGMTAAFGTVKNTSDKDIVITSGSTDVAKLVETHVMTMGDNGEMVMTRAKEGFTIPAGGTFELEPGGPHLMIMEMTKPVRTGDKVTVTVSTKDGQEIPFTVVGREFTGADEKYSPDASHTSSSH